MAKAEAGMAVNKGAIHALCVLDPGVAAVTLRLMCHAASARKTTLWRVVVDVSLSARA